MNANAKVDASGGLREWWAPIAFVICAGWAVWHTPAYILDLFPPADTSAVDRMTANHRNTDIIALPGLTGEADLLDWLALVLLPVIFIYGARTLNIARMEFPDWRPVDRFALMLGRVTMILILLATLVMLYEVLLRYAFEAPTLWANELTLWLAGYVFLFSGLYAMQQRCHIRIFLLYDACPAWLRHAFDIIGALLLVVYATLLIYGSYHQVFINKLYKWELFGTAFDPPIPATEQPFILVIIALIAAQAVANLIADWHRAPESHSPADLDADEVAALKKSVAGN